MRHGPVDGFQQVRQSVEGGRVSRRCGRRFRDKGRGHALEGVPQVVENHQGLGNDEMGQRLVCRQSIFDGLEK